jgi:LL-diaminopimelate aminotransferase
MIVPRAERLNFVEEYYFAAKLRQIKEMESAGARVINLGIGSPDLPPSQETMDRLVRSAADGRHYAYQPYKGIPELRAAMASYMQEYFYCALDPATEILPLPGSKQGMLYVTLAFVNPGDAVLVPDPGYPTYAGVARMTGARVIPYPLDPLKGWAPDWTALAQMDLSGVRLMWANYPHMPTGAPASAPLLDAIVQFAAEHHVLVCHDNPYAQLGRDDDLLSILTCADARDLAVELHSMSKSHNLSGWRIGWAAGSAECIDAIGRVASNVESGMSLSLQHAATVALQSDDSWYDHLRAEYAARRSRGERILTEVGCTVSHDQAGMFVWGRIADTSLDAEAVAEDMLQNVHVFLVPGTVFGTRGAGYLRLSLCSPVELLDEALSRIRKSRSSVARRAS